MPSHVVHTPPSMIKPAPTSQTPPNLPYAPHQTPALPPGVLAQEKRILKVDMMGHSWAVIETDFLKDPIFVPPNRTNGAADGDTVFVSIKKRPDEKLYARVEKVLVKAIAALANVPPQAISPPVPQHAQAPIPSYNPYAPIPITYSQPPKGHHSSPSNGQSPSSSASPKHPPIWLPPSQTAPSAQNAQPNKYIVPQHAMRPGQPPVYQPGAPNPYAPSPQAYAPSSNPYIKPQAYLPPSALPPQVQPQGRPNIQHSGAPSSVGYLASPPRTFKVVEGVLMNDSKTEAYVVPNDSNGMIHIPREFLAGASHGDLVRVHIIPNRGTADKPVGAILFRVGVHPSMAASESAPEIKDDEASGTFYPDLERWAPSAESDILPTGPPMDSAQQMAFYDYSSPSDVGSSQAPSHFPQHQAPSAYTQPSQAPAPASLPPGALPMSRSQLSSQAIPPSSSSASLGNRRPSIPNGYGGAGPNPRIPAGIHAQLKQVFNSRAKAHPPTMSYAEFVSALDSIGDFDALTRAFFDAANRSGWKIAGGSGGADAINLESFSHFVLTFLFADEPSQLRWSFSVLDPLESGFINQNVMRVQMELIFRLMLNMLLPVYLANPADMAEYMWLLLDDKRQGQISVEQYVEAMSKNRNAIIGLGLAQMPSVTPVPLPKRGYPVYPGHPSWPLVMQMMCGLSRALRAAQESSDYRSVSMPAGAYAPPPNLPIAGTSTSDVGASSAAASAALALPLQAFRQSNKFELRTVVNVQSKLTFTDYAPLVFRRIREIRGIDDAAYLYSLGVEQVLGNFLLGKLTTLAKEGSSGKSGQFFFTSHDGRFLIKTIARHERNTLYKMLPSYLAHLQTYPSSLLVPIYGMHDIDQLTIIVMGNVFNSPYVMDAAWDLKGSVVGRSAHGSFVKKDLDFDRGFVFGASANAALARQIRLDAQYLKSMNIVDYSLLAGYHVLNVDEAAVHDHRDLPASAHPYFDVGLRSYDPHSGSLKNEVWFLGIIDILIQFGVFKKAENWVKSLVHNPQGISIIPPDQYCERFSNYLVSCIR